MSRFNRIYWVAENGNITSHTPAEELVLRDVALSSGRRGLICHEYTGSRWIEHTIKADGYIHGKYKNPPKEVIDMALKDGIIEGKGPRK